MSGLNFYFVQNHFRVPRIRGYVQGQPLGFDTKYLALADRNIQIEFSLGIQSSGNLIYDPLIWLKVTSLSSTASVLREFKISLKFQESIQKKIFCSKHLNKAILTIILLILRILVVLNTSVASMSSTASLAFKN